MRDIAQTMRELVAELDADTELFEVYGCDEEHMSNWTKRSAWITIEIQEGEYRDYDSLREDILERVKEAFDPCTVVRSRFPKETEYPVRGWVVEHSGSDFTLEVCVSNATDVRKAREKRAKKKVAE